MVTEQTQFSMAELHEFLKNDSAPEASALNKREKAMVAFSRMAASELDLSSVGNIGNIQRVRVLADPATPEERRFEFVVKLPVAVLAEKAEAAKRAEAQAAKDTAILAFKVLLVTDPKKAESFLRTEGYKVLDRGVVGALLEASKEAQRAVLKARKAKPAAGATRKFASKAEERRYTASRVPKAKGAPSKVVDTYAAALEQDRLNRIKASKEASANLRKKAS